MNLRRLQAFRAVFELGSVTRAAETLHTAQPAVSRLIRELEQELGFALFERQRQRLMPTAEGKAFFGETERALAAVDRIIDAAHDIRTMKGEHLRIVVAFIAAFGIMPVAIKALLSTHPNVQVSLAIKDIREIADWVATGPFDVGITRMPLTDSRIECEPLATVRCVLVVPDSHRLAKRRVVSLDDLNGEQMVRPVQGHMHRDLIADAFASAGVPYLGSVATQSALSACQLVANGLGLAIVDPYSFRAAAGLRLIARPIRPPIEFALGVFYPLNRPRPNLVKTFVQAARSAAVSVLDGSD